MRFTGKIALLALLPLCSCVHKPLCLLHEPHASGYKAAVTAEWELRWEYPLLSKAWEEDWDEDYFGMSYSSLNPSVPEGLRIVAYYDETSYNYNISPEGGTITLADHDYSLLFYNNDTEYIVFNDVNSLAAASATTRTRTRASYGGNSYYAAVKSSTENTVNTPDNLWVNFIEQYTPIRSTEAEPLDVLMVPVVYSYLVRYEFTSGVEYVALARGALAGMAASVLLHDGSTSSEEATLLYDCSIESWGVQAVVNSFGIPNYPVASSLTRTDNVYALNLEVRMLNGNYLTFEYDVTDQVAAQPHGGVIVVDGIEITAVQGLSGSSGFGVSVTDWGEYEDVYLPM